MDQSTQLACTQPPTETSSVCSHFGSCGGCKTLHIPYDNQLIEKQNAVFDLYPQFSDIFLPIIGCESIWHYRNKMEYTFSSSLKGENFLGLYMRGRPNRVITLSECYLSPPSFIKILTKAFKWWEKSGLKAYRPSKNEGTLRNLMIREGKRTGQILVLLTISGSEESVLSADSLASFVEEIASEEGVVSISLRLQHIKKGMPTFFEEKLLFGKNTIDEILWRKEGDPLVCSLRSTSFFQPNTQQAEQIYRKVVELADPLPRDTVGDLYCGIGTIGHFFAPHVSFVYGLEVHPSSVEDAKETLLRNNVKNFEVALGEVGKTLWYREPPSLIVVDPPRCGLFAEAIEHILSLSPRKIIYVSCNPLTQQRDVQYFIDHGYRPYAIQPIDQFPHTPHIENIVALEKSF